MRVGRIISELPFDLVAAVRKHSLERAERPASRAEHVHLPVSQVVHCDEPFDRFQDVRRPAGELAAKDNGLLSVLLPLLGRPGRHEQSVVARRAAMSPSRAYVGQGDRTMRRASPSTTIASSSRIRAKVNCGW
jgi:hypothetical protein